MLVLRLNSLLWRAAEPAAAALAASMETPARMESHVVSLRDQARAARATLAKDRIAKLLASAQAPRAAKSEAKAQGSVAPG